MRSSQRGLTLVELVLAAGITAFALCGMVLFFTQSNMLVTINRNVSIATSHVQYVLEEIKNADTATLKSDIDNGNWDWNASEIESKGLSALGNEWIDTSESGTDLLDITATVHWQDSSTTNRQMTLETLIAT